MPFSCIKGDDGAADATIDLKQLILIYKPFKHAFFTHSLQIISMEFENTLAVLQYGSQKIDSLSGQGLKLFI
jgi:hypothetical protein